MKQIFWTDTESYQMTQIHRIWLGSKVPVKFKQYGWDWEEMNAGHYIMDWQDIDILGHKYAWYNQAVLDDMKKNSEKPGADLIAYYTHVADVIDYELLYEYGGWYFNTDLKPIKVNGLNDLQFDRSEPALAMEDDVHPVNMAMYSPPKHPFFKKVIDLLPQRYFGMPGAFMNATTGVQLLEHAIREFGPVQTFHRNVFNPLHWSEVEAGKEANLERIYPEETVAVHEWLHRTNQRGQRVLEQ